jgi:hypothetical protein
LLGNAFPLHQLSYQSGAAPFDEELAQMAKFKDAGGNPTWLGNDSLTIHK